MRGMIDGRVLGLTVLRSDATRLKRCEVGFDYRLVALAQTVQASTA